MQPELNDAVERWLKAHREADEDPQWRSMLDDLIGDYREHARLGIPLDEDASYGVVLRESLE